MSLTKNQQLLAYLCEKHPRATVTVLIKLAYFVDLVSVKKTGKKISDFEYIRYFYGPFSQDVYGDIEVLMQQNIFKATLGYASSGEEYAIYSVSEDVDATTLLDVPDEEKELVDGVLESLNGYGAKVLTEMAYKTKPMTSIGAQLGGKEHLNEVLNLHAN